MKVQEAADCFLWENRSTKLDPDVQIIIFILKICILETGIDLRI